MSFLPIQNCVQRGSGAVADRERLAWEHRKGLLQKAEFVSYTVRRGYTQEDVEAHNRNVHDHAADDQGRSYHIEDIHSLSMEDIQSLGGPESASDVPSLPCSQSSSSSADESAIESWMDAADVPTRPTSTILQEFPPLTRCPRQTATGSARSSDTMPSDGHFLTDVSYFPPDDLKPKRRIHPEAKDGSNEQVDAGDESDSCISTETSEEITWAVC